MLISFISVLDRFLTDVDSIQLSDLGGTFGIRRLDTGDIVVASGTELTHPETGLYQYELADTVRDVTYEVALKVETTQGTKYIRFNRYVAAEEVVASESDSISESESESDSGRSVQLIRDELVPVRIEGRGDLFLLKITATDPILMPSLFFTYQRKPADPRTGESFEEFMFVATPFDMTIYPIDTADPKQRPAFYRKNVFELLVPSSEVAEEIWEIVQAEVAGLVTRYNHLDYLTVMDEIYLDGSGTVTPVIAEAPELVCDAFDYDPGEEAAAITEELENAIGTTLLG